MMFEKSAGDDELRGTGKDIPIENEPLSPVLQRYEAKINELFGIVADLRAEAVDLEKSGKGLKSIVANVRASMVVNKIESGGGEYAQDVFIELPEQKAEEDGSIYDMRASAVINQYRSAIKDSPQIILRMAEVAGEVDLGRISPRLLKNERFIAALAKTEAAKKDYKFQVALENNLFGLYAGDQASPIRY